MSSGYGNLALRIDHVKTAQHAQLELFSRKLLAEFPDYQFRFRFWNDPYKCYKSYRAVSLIIVSTLATVHNNMNFDNMEKCPIKVTIIISNFIITSTLSMGVSSMTFT